MTVQNLFDLLADEDPDELDSEARWNKVYEVLPWLLKMLWAFYEDYDGPEQTAVSIAWGIISPLYEEDEDNAKDVLEHVKYLAGHMLHDWKNLSEETRARLEQVRELLSVYSSYKKKPPAE
jgi:hypothetical protein